MAARAAPQLARADPLGGVGPLGALSAAFDAAAPDAKQVAVPFHVVRLANTALDEVRHRVQNQTLGQPRPQTRPAVSSTQADSRRRAANITDNGRTRLRGLLDACDPYGEVRDAWHAKETPAQRL